MAEVAATIIAIVTFGAQISNVLYDVGACINGIRADTDRVANNVSMYSDVLELLAERFKSSADSESPIYSSKALKLANKICSRSSLIFEDIHRRLPRSHDAASNSFAWVERAKWYFRRKRVNGLVNELECLKSTANLLLSVLAMGRSIRKHRRRRRRRQKQYPDDEKPDTDSDVELQTTLVKSQNSLVSYFDAVDKLAESQRAADDDDYEEEEAEADSLEDSARDNSQRETNNLEISNAFRRRQQSQTALIVREDSQAIVNVSKSLNLEDTTMGKRQLLIGRVDSILDTLLREWTRLNLDEDEYTEIIKAHMTQLSERRHSPYSQIMMQSHSHSSTDSLETDQHHGAPNQDDMMEQYKDSPVGKVSLKRPWSTPCIDDDMLAMGIKISLHPDSQLFEIVDTGLIDSGEKHSVYQRGKTNDLWTPQACNALENLRKSIRAASSAIMHNHQLDVELNVSSSICVEMVNIEPTGNNVTRVRSHTHENSRTCGPKGVDEESSDDMIRRDSDSDFASVSSPLYEPEYESADEDGQNNGTKYDIDGDDLLSEFTKAETESQNHIKKLYMPITLDEQCSGVCKRIKIQRNVYDGLVKAVICEDKILSIDVRPSVQFGSKIKYKSVDLAGNPKIGFSAVDIHVIITEKKERAVKEASQEQQPKQFTHSSAESTIPDVQSDTESDMTSDARDQIQIIHTKFHTQLLPEVRLFVEQPSHDLKTHQQRYTRLYESIYQQVFEAGDAIELTGNQKGTLRKLRKNLYLEAEQALRDLEKWKMFTGPGGHRSYNRPQT